MLPNEMAIATRSLTMDTSRDTSRDTCSSKLHVHLVTSPIIEWTDYYSKM